MRINWKERQRRIHASLGAAWDNGVRTPEDPGLREAYDDIARAPIRLITLPLNKDANHGGLLRIADAFRLERVEFGRQEDRSNDFSGHRGTAGWQPYRWVDADESIAEAKRDGYALCALTLSERSVALDRVEWRFPLAIILGSEQFGVPAQIEERCDLVVGIPLFGLITSLNVATAGVLVVHAAISAYALQHPEFQPVRRSSRRLLGFEPLEFRAPEE